MTKKEKWRVKHTVGELIRIIEMLKQGGLWEELQVKIATADRVPCGSCDHHIEFKNIRVQDYYKLIVKEYEKIKVRRLNNQKGKEVRYGF